MSGIISDSSLLELERLRSELVSDLQDKGISISSDATINVAIQKTKNLYPQTQILDRTIAKLYDENVTSLASYFMSSSSLQKANFPNAREMKGDAFNGSSSLQYVLLPELVSMVSYSQFKSCTNIKWVYLPKYTGGNGNQLCRDCSNLKYYITPKSTSLQPEDPFFRCASLELVDTKATAINQKLYNTSKLILRSDTVPSLSSTSNIANNDCVIYIAQSLISTLKTSTNWSALPNITDRVLALENSIYEDEDWFEGTEDYQTAIGEWE